MAAYPNTGSIINNSDGSNRTGVALSTQIIIKVNDQAVGAVQTLSISEKREISMISEVGNDGILDSAPTKSTTISGSCNRVRFDRLRASEAFGRDFLHAHSQRIPFDMDVYDFWGGNTSAPIITTIRNVWIAGLSYDYKVDNWMIFDNMEWQAEAIYSSINGANAATGGERGTANMQFNKYELNADRGLTRGTMDQPDLIHDFFGNL